MQNKPKLFFQEPTATTIEDYRYVRYISQDFIDNILDIPDDEAVIIEGSLIPEEFGSSRKFIKHGKEVKLKRYRSLEQIAKSRKTPVQLREEAFNKIQNNAYSGYSFKPFMVPDKRTRKVSLVECLEGTRIYCYANQQIEGKPSISVVKSYKDSSGVEKDGADIIVKVPSRTKKMSRYNIKFMSVPVVDSRMKWGIAYGISSDHNCMHKKYLIRFRHKNDKETSRQFNFCAHEIAGYLGIIDHFHNNHKNLIPLQMSQFAIPTQYTVDFYKKLCNNSLIRTDSKVRKLNKSEKEIFLWGLVYKQDHDSTFYAAEKVKDYNWKI